MTTTGLSRSTRISPAPIVAIVGIDGAGKTTQAHLLAGWLNAVGQPADYWQNAGGRRWFGRLAQFFGRPDAQSLLGVGGMLLVEAVLRWLAIARALVRSRLLRRTAVMDRYSWCQYASIRAHVGVTRPHVTRPPFTRPPFTRPPFTKRERRARRWYGLFPEPDLTVFLAATPGCAWARVEARGTDHEDLDHLAAADTAYRSLAEADRFVVVDANRDTASVQRELREVVGRRFGIELDDVVSEPERIVVSQ